MAGLSDSFGVVQKKWKELSGKKRIGLIVLISGIIVSAVLLLVYVSKPKYAPLFLDMQPEDQAKVVSMLKQQKVSYKLDGSSILVPEGKIDELRLNVLSSGTLPSDGKGFEIFDSSNFGMTDTQTRILYQSALETELQRTIKAFDEIEYARVHLVLPESSAFVSEEQPAKASVTLKLKNNEKLGASKVKAIIALVSGSVENLDPKNVQVVDSNYNYLSENLYADDSASVTTAGSSYDMKIKFEGDLADDIKKMLEAVYGPDKVIVKVNADLDFDSTETTSIKYDTKGIIQSQNKIVENNSDGTGGTSGSPTNENQASTPSYTIPNGSGNTGSTRSEETTNYDVGHVEQKTISAPGQVKALSTSVVIDGMLTDGDKQSVANIVKAATGYVNNQNRQDQIDVEGMEFDTSLRDKVDSDIKDMQKQETEAKRNSNLFKLGLCGLGAIIAVLTAIILRRRKSYKNMGEPEMPFTVAGNNGPIAGPIAVEANNIPAEANGQEQAAAALDEAEEKKTDIKDEIKSYANKSPDQVAEIIKTWLAEDDR